MPLMPLSEIRVLEPLPRIVTLVEDGVVSLRISMSSVEEVTSIKISAGPPILTVVYGDSG